MSEGAIKPPLGIKSRFIRDENRIDEIEEAIQRFAMVRQAIPHDWIVELAELYKRKEKE